MDSAKVNIADGRSQHLQGCRGNRRRWGWWEFGSLEEASCGAGTQTPEEES